MKPTLEYYLELLDSCELRNDASLCRIFLIENYKSIQEFDIYITEFPNFCIDLDLCHRKEKLLINLRFNNGITLFDYTGIIIWSDTFSTLNKEFYDVLEDVIK